CRSALACQPRRRKSADADKAVYLPLRSAKKSCSMSTWATAALAKSATSAPRIAAAAARLLRMSQRLRPAVLQRVPAGAASRDYARLLLQQRRPLLLLSQTETGDTVASATSATPAAGSNSSEQPTDSAAVSGTTAPPATTPSKREQLIVSAGSNRTIELPSQQHRAARLHHPGAHGGRCQASGVLVEGRRHDNTDSNRVGKAVVMVIGETGEAQEKRQRRDQTGSLSIQAANQQRPSWTASGSVDGDQRIESYHWQGVHEPVLHCPRLVEGDYAFESDRHLTPRAQTDSATVNVLVKRRPKNAFASGRTCRSPVCVLNGVAVDDTVAAKLANATQPSVTLTNLQAGVYKPASRGCRCDGRRRVGGSHRARSSRANQARRTDAWIGLYHGRTVSGYVAVALDASKSWDDKGIVNTKWT
uniref:YDG domain-containing protein n=1 Tax=Macrostomum lignano TaxID=282301 RepID=A0A1I8FIJ0_9PLAT